ncbi:uncharacterized protein LOC105701758 isoform X2 [Orussus abietinus]|uniref:uncharacterized protein LOC105701758 isoform X2 n=1 Tax=Orussus abietinus TaxID=222816 RepID=UPI0006264776|nr:uncharacterized protein LOC105701758 isoform X2 [Orussus abietinus]
MSQMMSLIGEGDVCHKMIEGEIDLNRDCSEYGNSIRFVCDGKSDSEIEGQHVDNEDIVTDHHMEGVAENTSSDNIEEAPVYFEEALDACEEVTVDYNEHSSSISFFETKVKEEWYGGESDEFSPATPDCETSGTLINHEDTEERENQDGEDEDEEDEETIATFVTAAGQQLALYAVEDSDEIFAVAVYDESGEPPTNFQFLMKADVERLIGEGAVRTVKKPSQMKKQLLTAPPPVFVSRNLHQQGIPENEKSKPYKSSDFRLKHESKSINASQDSMLASDKHVTSSLFYSPGSKQSNVTYMIMGNDKTNSNREGSESENEIVEQSTVQYILFGDNQSDSELTFDEIEATLQNLKGNQSKSKNSHNKKMITDHKIANGVVTSTSDNHFVDTNSHFTSQEICSGTLDFNYKGHQNSFHTKKVHSSSLIGKKQHYVEGKSGLLNMYTSDHMSVKQNLSTNSPQGTLSGSIQIGLRVKRSRKQQLTSVNRGDSEIIIQPASLLCEEESTSRKRGKRRKKNLPDPDYNPRSSRSKKLKKARKHRSVEIIDLDIDEEEGERDIVEITLDDNKEKDSSDKENEVIMVGDSDDESQEPVLKLPPPLLQCEYCSRNFRQKRALDTHSRVCSMSPSNIRKTKERSMRIQANENGETTVKKQYPCKICQQKFDVVVALARHVRAEHSLKKRSRTMKSAVEVKPATPPPTEEEKVEEKSTPIKRTKKQHSQSLNRRWKIKKLNCTDCGRWFPSAALLSAHCLQHATKKSEQKPRKCQTCKKIIKSRLLYIRHLRMHSSVKEIPKSISNTLQKKLRHTRQSTSNIKSLRKRGRPRKL